MRAFHKSSGALIKKQVGIKSIESLGVQDYRVQMPHPTSKFTPPPQPDYFSTSSNDVGCTRIVDEDHLVTVTGVIVMGPDFATSAEASGFLHDRYRFIHELVLWNNQNQIINYQMLPYDLATRYVTTPRNYGTYARVLGCLLARHEVCYFQHDTLRPAFLDSVFATFLREASAETRRPNTRVVTAVATADVVYQREWKFSNGSRINSKNRCGDEHMFTLVDWDAGVIAHKAVAKRHIRMMAVLGASAKERSTDMAELGTCVADKAVVSDLLLSYGLIRQPILLRHRMREEVDSDGLDAHVALRHRLFSHEVTLKAASLVAHLCSPDESSHFTSKTVDRETAQIKIKKSSASLFRALCADGRCTLVTNMGNQPDIRTNVAIDMASEIDVVGEPDPLGSLAALIMEEGQQASASGPTTLTIKTMDWRLSHYAAVDVDIETAWLATWTGHRFDDDNSVVPYLGLEMLRPTQITGLRLVLAAGVQTSTLNISYVPRLEFAFQPSAASYTQAVGCVANWLPSSSIVSGKLRCRIRAHPRACSALAWFSTTDSPLAVA